MLPKVDGVVVCEVSHHCRCYAGTSLDKGVLHYGRRASLWKQAHFATSATFFASAFISTHPLVFSGCQEFETQVVAAYLERETARQEALAARRRREAVSGWMHLLQAMRTRLELQARHEQPAAAKRATPPSAKQRMQRASGRRQLQQHTILGVKKDSRVKKQQCIVPSGPVWLPLPVCVQHCANLTVLASGMRCR